MYSTNVRAFNIKRKTVEGVITLLWHLAPAFTLQRVADLFFAPARPNLSAEQSRMIASFPSEIQRLPPKITVMFGCILPKGWGTRACSPIRVSQRPHSTIWSAAGQSVVA